MELIKIMNQYYRIKKEMEVTGRLYGLTDSRTIRLSKELDSLVNAVMTLKNLGRNDFDRKKSKYVH
ncbi:aspartyl-phosphate phosphatase Spo0E family protein [Neobacillus niacini]|uniref:aspartyl-phosphate phosphatase Spo0E family protein n=1 Tax=Neobacillus niacini TaxID=86668 RepID=UPI002FFD8C06